MSNRAREVLGEVCVSDVRRTLHRAKRDKRQISRYELEGFLERARLYEVQEEVQQIIDEYNS